MTPIEFANELIVMGRRSSNISEKSVTVNIGWAVKRGDKFNVIKLVKSHGEYITGGKETIDKLILWATGRWNEI